jgi:succinate CoA transferase
MSIKIITAEEAASFINNNDNVAFSGFTLAGSPKVVPKAIANRAREEHSLGRPFKIGMFTGASTGDSCDGELARAHAVKFRTPFQSNKDLKKLINIGEVDYFDMHLSQISQEMRYKFLGEIDVAIIEAVEVSDDGEIVLSTSVGISNTAAVLAKKVIIERNSFHPKELKGFHDIYELENPPFRQPIMLTRVRDRIGTMTVKIDPSKILGIVETNKPDEVGEFRPADELTSKIGNNVAAFLANEIKNGIIPKDFLPLQSGIGNVCNAVLAALGTNKDIPPFTMFTEVIQDSVIQLMRQGKVTFASGCSLMVAPNTLKEVYNDLDFFKERMVLRPQEISNAPEVVRRLGIIAMNTALEADIFGNINSTHVLGTDMMNGIGGSGDFARNSFLSIFVCPSTAKGGLISTIVPMVSHIDHSEHSVKVLVTEYGVADLRGKSPKQRAETIIENCVHPDYKQLLRDYLNISGKLHTPHALHACMGMHVEFSKSGDMRNTNWSEYE